MKEHPIVFSAPMVRAIRAGKKTQTRRVAKPRRNPSLLDGSWIDSYALNLGNAELLMMDNPYGQPGDQLWVRETWAPVAHGGIRYRADDENLIVSRWRPSIHMPRAASRILLEIVAVRVERLQEITNDDARAEGPEAARPHRHGTEGLEWEPHPGEIVRDPYAGRHNTGVNDCWICAYRNIWESINGPGSWDANPWVWVVEFRIVNP